MNHKERKNYPLPRTVSIKEFVKDKEFLCFSPKDTLYEIVSTMRQRHNYAVLITENENLVGLLTEHRILLYLLSGFTAPVRSMERVTKTFSILQADEAMIRYPQTIDADLMVDDAFHRISENGFRYMPVVKNGIPVGIINRTELTSYMEEKNRKELESKDMMLSYLMHHENYGCVS